MIVHIPSLAMFGLPGGAEWIVIGILGLLIFGKRLPEVGKSLGKSIVEFKKGLKGVEEEIDKAVDAPDQNDMLPPPEQTANQNNEAKTQQSQNQETKAV